jgi:hypothetical protein
MGGGKERKMTGGSAAANFVKDCRKSLKQKLLKTESTTKHILSNKLSTQHNAEFLGLPGIK